MMSSVDIIHLNLFFYSMLQEKHKCSALLKMALVEQPDTAKALELILAKTCTSENMDLIQ